MVTSSSNSFYGTHAAVCLFSRQAQIELCSCMCTKAQYPSLVIFYFDYEPYLILTYVYNTVKHRIYRGIGRNIRKPILHVNTYEYTLEVRRE